MGQVQEVDWIDKLKISKRMSSGMSVICCSLPLRLRGFLTFVWLSILASLSVIPLASATLRRLVAGGLAFDVDALAFSLVDVFAGLAPFNRVLPSIFDLAADGEDDFFARPPEVRLPVVATGGGMSCWTAFCSCCALLREEDRVLDIEAEGGGIEDVKSSGGKRQDGEEVGHTKSRKGVTATTRQSREDASW